MNTSFADAVAAHITTKVDHVQADAILLHLLQGAERIGRRPEGAIQSGRDHHVAPSKQPTGVARPTLGERTEPETPASMKHSATTQPFIITYPIVVTVAGVDVERADTLPG